jgi:hypothetical protein
MENENLQPVLAFNENSQRHLTETRKWTQFFSIVFILALGIIIAVVAYLFFVSSSEVYSAIPKSVAVIYCLVICVLYVFPIYYLMKFSSNAKYAIAKQDSVALAASMRYLKLHYRYMGIVAIVVLCIYAIVFLLMFLMGAIPKF